MYFVQAQATESQKTFNLPKITMFLRLEAVIWEYWG